MDMNPNLLSPEVLGQRRGNIQWFQIESLEEMSYISVVFRESSSEYFTCSWNHDRFIVEHICTSPGRRRWREWGWAWRRSAVEIAEWKNCVRIEGIKWTTNLFIIYTYYAFWFCVIFRIFFKFLSLLMKKKLITLLTMLYSCSLIHNIYYNNMLILCNMYLMFWLIWKLTYAF